MNNLRGNISKITVNGNLTLLDIDVSGENFKAIIVERPENLSFLEVGNNIAVMFKETEVIIGKKMEHAISLRNRLLCSISSIEKGTLLSKLVLKHKAGEIRSIITRNAVESLDLQEGEEIWAMIKTNEVTIAE